MTSRAVLVSIDMRTGLVRRWRRGYEFWKRDSVELMEKAQLNPFESEPFDPRREIDAASIEIFRKIGLAS